MQVQPFLATYQPTSCATTSVSVSLMHCRSVEQKQQHSTGSNLEPLLGEALLELLRVFDDAIVHQCDAARRVQVRVRVNVGLAAVRGPPCVSDGHVLVAAVLLRRLGEPLQRVAGGHAGSVLGSGG